MKKDIGSLFELLVTVRADAVVCFDDSFTVGACLARSQLLARA
jgi:hypothetical protein